MNRTAHRYRWRFNRRKVFEKDGVRLWISGQNPDTGVRLTLEKLKAGTSSAWSTEWEGRVSYDQNEAEVETLRLAGED